MTGNDECQLLIVIVCAGLPVATAPRGSEAVASSAYSGCLVVSNAEGVF